MALISRFTFVCEGVYRSPLPLAREIREFAAIGGAAVLDLTRRPRPTVQRACDRFGIMYHKHGMPYDFTAAHVVVAFGAALVLPRPLAIHCFHGRDRTGAVVGYLLQRQAVTP